MQFDYSALRHAIKASGMRLDWLAEASGISRCYLCTKLTQGKPFTSEQILGLARPLSISDHELPEYFFTLETAKTQR